MEALCLQRAVEPLNQQLQIRDVTTQNCEDNEPFIVRFDEDMGYEEK